MALASGKSQVTVSEISNHCQTNIWVIEKFLDGKFEIKDYNSAKEGSCHLASGSPTLPGLSEKGRGLFNNLVSFLTV